MIKKNQFLPILKAYLIESMKTFYQKINESYKMSLLFCVYRNRQYQATQLKNSFGVAVMYTFKLHGCFFHKKKISFHKSKT